MDVTETSPPAFDSTGRSTGRMGCAGWTSVATAIRSLDSGAAMHIGDDCGARPVFIAAATAVAHRQRRVETAGSGAPQGSRAGSIPAVASLFINRKVEAMAQMIRPTEVRDMDALVAIVAAMQNLR